MRTLIFKKYANLPKDFLEDFKVIWDLSSKQRKEIIPGISQIYKTNTNAEADEIKTKLVESVDGDPKTLLKAIKALLFLYRSWNPLHDTAEGFLDDLDTLSLIPSKNKEAATSFVLEFFSAVSQDNLERIQKSAAMTAIPTFSGLSGVVDFRPFFDKQFGSDITYKIKDYNPSCIGWTPVILLDFERNGSNNNSFHFQCSESELRIIIDYLNSVLIEYDIAKAVFPEKEWLNNVED